MPVPCADNTMERPVAEHPASRRTVGPAQVTGVLLCGGSSRRMGHDKAAAELRGRRMIEYPLAALEAVAGRVLLAVGATPRYADLGRELVVDAHADGGPLAGLCAGLAAARTEWIAVLACDMPRAEASCLVRLLDEAVAHDADVCLLEIERGTQPTFGVYRRTCLAAVASALDVALDG